jgi:hypothetical protein
MIQASNGDVFESGCELVDVTSCYRPDPSWRYTDQSGHEHRWYVNGQPAESYSPTAQYSLPTLAWVVDYVAYYEDGEPYDVGHYECAVCSTERVQPRYTADTFTQYVPGLRWFRVNGESVSAEEFKRRMAGNGWEV